MSPWCTPPGSLCVHWVLLSLEAFNGGSSNTRIIDLKRRLRCDSKVIVSVVWASYAGRRG
jgi:hypothetical protein